MWLGHSERGRGAGGKAREGEGAAHVEACQRGKNFGFYFQYIRKDSRWGSDGT